MKRIVFDMETGDPDDFVTLLLLLGHPRVDLAGVTINPGTREQVGLVRMAMEWFDVELPVGARNLDHQKPCVSGWHQKAFGSWEPSDAADPAAELLEDLCDEDTTLVTGAPLHNLGAALNRAHFTLGTWVCQGGFAGEGVVPAEKQLEKFRGLRTCPTYNLGGQPRAALRAIADPRIESRWFVSKNVCHGVVYDLSIHEMLRPIKDRAAHLRRIWHGMAVYLKAPVANEAIEASTVRYLAEDGKRENLALEAAVRRAKEAGLDLVVVRDGLPPLCRAMRLSDHERVKAFHDPLAACCAIEPDIGEWAEVELYRERGEWGARLRPGSGSRIIAGYDRRRFWSVFSESELT